MKSALTTGIESKLGRPNLTSYLRTDSAARRISVATSSLIESELLSMCKLLRKYCSVCSPSSGVNHRVRHPQRNRKSKSGLGSGPRNYISLSPPRRPSSLPRSFVLMRGFFALMIVHESRHSVVGNERIAPAILESVLRFGEKLVFAINHGERGEAVRRTEGSSVVPPSLTHVGKPHNAKPPMTDPSVPVALFPPFLPRHSFMA